MGIQSKCVCNTSGTYNVTDINPLVDTDKKSSRKYCKDVSNELRKNWDNHTMYTQQLHSFDLDSYILVRFLYIIFDEVLFTSFSLTIFFLFFFSQNVGLSWQFKCPVAYGRLFN